MTSEQVPRRSQRLVITDVRVRGTPATIEVIDGFVARIDVGRSCGGPESIDGGGAEVISGLHDHHAHLLSTAAWENSVSVEDCDGDLECVLGRISEAARHSDGDEWIRVVGYREHSASAAATADSALTRRHLDAAAGGVPVRVQDATGGLWVLSTSAMARVPWRSAISSAPGEVVLDERGEPTGRFVRLDRELGALWPEVDLSRAVRRLSERLLRFGVTGLTDATPGSPPAILRRAAAEGGIHQDLHFLAESKIVLSDHALPSLDELCEKIDEVHRSSRSAAIHTVTIESAYLACHAFAIVGSRQGDRLEHLAQADDGIIGMAASLGLIVVTQPGFIEARGDHYRRSLSDAELDQAYRYRSLVDAGVTVVPSSDCPYGPWNPWIGIGAGAQRRTRGGYPLAPGECVSAATTLRGYQQPLRNPAVQWDAASGPVGVPAVGKRADFCLLRRPVAEILADLSDASRSGNLEAVADRQTVKGVVIGDSVWEFD